ncbi:class I SAM-dependent methyltransferase [Winogradskyella vincentii]|uniref:Class I SAM-dependent methyltransferase n=1 Tax=Winogradskyella vincentii TaxID=2877122 RepID=A0ABS7XW56_9FLAO|nr:class I SAM-dependent methyltransferase [Winogradskyella vincentii]MCA0151878.1 class I SAM-dependent methyltransferase [Winogradskyella vincentii]
MSRVYSCDLCDSGSFHTKLKLTRSLGITDDAKFNVVKCKACGLHSLHPIPDDDEFKLIYKYYAQKGNRLDVENKRLKEVYPRKVEFIQKYFKDAKTVLDIGAGNGGFVSLASSMGYDVIGIELEKSQVELAKQVFKVDLIHSSIEDFSKIEHRKFDVINLHHVFEHVQEPFNILMIIKRLLSPNGIVLIEVPNQFFRFPNKLYFELGLKDYRKPYNPYHHLYFYSKKHLLSYFNKTGFDVVFFNDKMPAINVKHRAKNLISKAFNLSPSHIFEMVLQNKLNNL